MIVNKFIESYDNVIINTYLLFYRLGEGYQITYHEHLRWLNHIITDSTLA